MSAIWLDLSGRADPLAVRLLDRLAAVFAENGISFVLIGATARDLILVHGYGLPIRRATQDVDCAVLLKNWESFKQIRAALLETGDFEAGREPQRLLFENTVPVDLIPFGPVAEGDILAWPPERSVRMSVLGMREALEEARLIRLRTSPPLDIPVAPLALLAALKLIAWSERPEERRKDALDLALFLTSYLDAGNRERLSEDHADLLGEDFDYETAGAHLLGRDLARSARPAMRKKLQEILSKELAVPESSKLLLHMTGQTRLMEFEKALALLEALRKGLEESGRS